MPHSAKTVPVSDDALASLAARLAAGGVLSRAELCHGHSWRTLERALEQNVVRRLGRGAYTLGSAPPTGGPRSWSQWDDPVSDVEVQGIAADLALARAHRGVLAGMSAARAHGWMLPDEPTLPTVIVPRDRRPTLHPRGPARLLRRDLVPSMHENALTTPLVTAMHCMLELPFDTALAVADSALRSLQVGPHELREAADRCTARGARQARRVAAHADARSANPFESMLRAVTLDVDRLAAVPQVTVSTPTLTARVDLADERLRIVLEADSYEWHGGKTQFTADIDRYDALVADDWLVLRHTLRQVRTQRDFVRRQIQSVTDLRSYGSVVGTTRPSTDRARQDDGRPRRPLA